MKRISSISIIYMCCMAFCFSACQDIVTYNEHYDDDTVSNGSPVIHAVYDAKDREKLLPIISGNFEQMIMLDGDNLSCVKKIMFNDVELPVSEAYATAHCAYLPIPREIPMEVNNLLYYETDLGSTTYDFMVSVPLIQVEGLYNEFALPGSSVQLKGNFFDLYGFGEENTTSTIKMNGIELEVDSISDKYMSVVIPKTAPDNSIIEIKYTGAGGDVHTEQIPYRMTEAVIWDFSRPDDYGLWAGKELIVNETGENDPEMLYGPYFRVTGNFGAWNWTNLVCGGFNCPADVAAHPEDYNFKFEVYSPTGHPFYDSAEYGYLIQLNNGNFPWNPSAHGSFNTYGKWCTVSINLQTLSANAFSEGWTGLSFILQPNSDWNVDHSFANIRIEKKLNK